MSAFPLSPSGLSSVDANWGGFVVGGTYLIVGHARAGRTRHLMASVRAAASPEELCLLVSAKPREALIDEAARMGFDLRRASQLGQLRLLQSPPPEDLAEIGDEGLEEATRDLLEMAKNYGASRVVVDDFSAFVQYQVFETFARSFRRLLEDADEADVTLVLGLGEPGNPASENLLAFIRTEVAGTVHVTVDDRGKRHFELFPGKAHAPTLHDPVEIPPPPVSDDAADPTERQDPAAESPEEEIPAVPEDTPELPPFELSFPSSDGGDGDHSDEPPELVVPDEKPDPADTYGDSLWANITPVSPSDAPFTPEEFESFVARRSGPQTQPLFPSRSATRRRAPGSSIDPSRLESEATEIQRAAYPQIFDQPEAEDPSQAFKRALADAFAQRPERHFLVMALRIAPDDPYADVFSTVAEGVRIAIGRSGEMLAGAQRLIALLPDAGADVARNVLAILKAHLRTRLPHRADRALERVNAIAVPNGEPYSTAAELFEYAYGD